MIVIIGRQNKAVAYYFANFRYDALAGRLLRGEKEIALRPKARALLGFLLENGGRLLSHEEVLDRVWPDVVVTDDALRFQVAELRRALGDRRGRLLKTIPAEGYRFDMVIERDESLRPRIGARPSPQRSAYRCRLFLETREIALAEGESIIGREPASAIWLDDPLVSRRHARIVVANGRATLEDLASRNGTRLCGTRIGRPRRLEDGDEIRIGPVRMIFRELLGTETTKSSGAEEPGSP